MTRRLKDVIKDLLEDVHKQLDRRLLEMNKRTIADVIKEWRESRVNNDDGELASRINYFIMTDWPSESEQLPLSTVWVWEKKIGDKWVSWQDEFNGGALLVHPTNKYIEQPKPHEPQFGRFRWTEYCAALRGQS